VSTTTSASASGLAARTRSTTAAAVSNDMVSPSPRHGRL
jgi:hypothetical protein